MSNALKFEEFHAANPLVFQRMAEEAYRWSNSGGTKLGIGMLVAHIRWMGQVEQWGDFKINENHGAFYARLLQVEYPALVGLFDMRTSEADDWVISKYPESKVAAKIQEDRERRADEAIRWHRKAS